MTWEQTIEHIRQQEAYADLVRDAYLQADLGANVERFRASEEFAETTKLINQYAPNARLLLDIGCGNGISTIALSLAGYQVTAVEPDPSSTVGANAIRTLCEQYKRSNIKVYEALAEDIAFPDETFDVVYFRQAMHHASSLNKFVGEAGRVLRKGGILFSVRDHVVFDEEDKLKFLIHHPLQKFYGGENAFSPEEYRKAMNNAGLTIVKEFKYYDSVLNYFPITEENIKKQKIKEFNAQKKGMAWWKKLWLRNMPDDFQPDERLIPGRMYSYIALKS